MSGYYNEFDPKAAAWLQELMTRGLIPAGVIDTRSIEDVRPLDLVGFTQCHFFAGIGGWPLALEIAGIAPEKRVWTGSCPCQPFSAAGRRKGFADDRHLWPAWFWLIEQLRPAVVLGEQVSSPAGRAWLDVVRSNLATRGYSTGAADLCAAGVGAPHIRQRLYWVALAGGERLARERLQLRSGQPHHTVIEAWGRGQEFCPHCGAGIGGHRRFGEGTCPHCNALDAEWVEHPSRAGGWGHTGAVLGAQEPGSSGGEGIGSESDVSQPAGADGRLANSQSRRLREGSPSSTRTGTTGHGPADHGSNRSVADSNSAGSQGRSLGGDSPYQRSVGPAGVDPDWSNVEWALCKDPTGEKWRPIEPGTFPLVDGFPERVGLLRGYGNAIVPQVAATFIRAAIGG